MAELIEASVEEISLLHIKHNDHGSTSHAQKYKTLQGWWMGGGRGEEILAVDGDHTMELSVHMRIKISQGRKIFGKGSQGLLHPCSCHQKIQQAKQV